MQLYTEQDFVKTKSELTKRWLILGAMILATFVLAALFVSVLRNRIAVIAAAVAGSALCYTYLAIKLLPWLRYWAFQNDMRHGLTRETDAWFVSCSDSTRISDGVEFHEFIVRIGDGEEDERLFFWDDDKQLPPIEVGRKLHIRSFGNYITELNFIE